MPELIGFRNVDNLNVEPTGSAAPTAGAPAVETQAVEPPAAVAPVVEAATTVVPVVEEKKDEVVAPVVEEEVEDSTSDEKYFEYEGVKYIKAEDVKGIVQKRVGRLNQDKIQAAAAELAKDAVNAKKLLENDNKELKRENEVLKLSKGDETRFETLNETGLSGEALRKLAERLGAVKPVVNNTAEKEFREKLTEKPSTTFNAAAVMAAAREGRK